MASRPWSEDEVAVLEHHADERDWLDKAIAKLPDRSPKALRSRMQKVRLELGPTHDRYVDRAWMAEAANASQRLLAAIQRAGLSAV
jgi:hypothetical protein